MISIRWLVKNNDNTDHLVVQHLTIKVANPVLQAKKTNGKVAWL